jgi:hypothetical protein
MPSPSRRADLKEEAPAEGHGASRTSLEDTWIHSGGPPINLAIAGPDQGPPMGVHAGGEKLVASSSAETFRLQIPPRNLPPESTKKPRTRRCPGQARQRNRAGTAVAVRNRNQYRDGRRHRHTGGLQQAPRQHDDIVGFPRAKPRQGRCRWSAAARNRCRPPVRCTGRMVASATDAGVRTLTLRIPRSGSSTVHNRLNAGSSPAGSTRHSYATSVSWRGRNGL